MNPTDTSFRYNHLPSDMQRCSAMRGRILKNLFAPAFACVKPFRRTGAKFWQRLLPEDHNRVRETIMRAVGEKHSLAEGCSIVLPDGTMKHIQVSGQPVFDTNGEVIEYVGTGIDVTERKRAEGALQEQADLLSLTDDAILVCEMNRVTTYWNRGAEKLYGWPAEQACGRFAHDLLKTVFPAPLEQIEAEVIRACRWEGELIHTTKYGTQIVAASRWSLQCDNKGTPVAILETNNDVTERERGVSVLAGEKQILEMVAKGDPLSDILDSTCRLVEEQSSGVLASILLLRGNRLRYDSAPSFPKAFKDSIG